MPEVCSENLDGGLVVAAVEDPDRAKEVVEILFWWVTAGKLQRERSQVSLVFQVPDLGVSLDHSSLSGSLLCSEFQEDFFFGSLGVLFPLVGLILNLVGK